MGGENSFRQKKSLLQRHVKGRQVMIVSNETIAAFYLDPLKAIYQDFQCDTFILPDGEQYKTLEYWER
ncbi:3-dehydroquinate synthase, partial [Coxiella burnetii Q321]